MYAYKLMYPLVTPISKQHCLALILYTSQSLYLNYFPLPELRWVMSICEAFDYLDFLLFSF